MRVLVVTNFEPDESAPQRGRWVRDQIDEVRRRGVEVDVFSFPPGRNEYIPATRRLRSLLKRERFDVVHAHYGLPGWCALLAGARPLLVTFHGTDVRHHLVGPMSRRLAWRVDLVAAVSRAIGEVLGLSPEYVVSPGTYDQKHIDRIGRMHNCIAYGPGILDLAHQPDEYVGVDDMLDSAKVMALTLLELLGSGR